MGGARNKVKNTLIFILLAIATIAGSEAQSFEKITPITGIILRCEEDDISDCNEQYLLNAASDFASLRVLDQKSLNASHIIAYKHKEKYLDPELWTFYDFKLINLKTREIEYSTGTVDRFKSDRPSNWTVYHFFQFLSKYAVKK